MDRRFARSRRLLKASDYRAVFDQGLACSSEYFTLLGRVNEGSVGRVGLAIAKRRIARAARRNAVKRIVRESFRHHQHELTALDIVVIAKTAADTGDRKRLRTTLDAQWARLARRVRRKHAADTRDDG